MKKDKKVDVADLYERIDRLEERLVSIRDFLISIGDFLQKNFSLGARLLKEQEIRRIIKRERQETKSAISAYLNDCRKNDDENKRQR